MRILDRYVLRNFLEPFFLCFGAFLGILLIFDLNDNITDFLAAKAKWKQIGFYYLHQLPHFVLLSMPLGLLLGLLYCLSKMSRSNEIISMLGSGRSIIRLIMPLIGCGVVATGICLALNYEMAPRADGTRKADLERITKGEKKTATLNYLESQLAKDRMTNRIWFVRKIRLDEVNTLYDAHITQLDSHSVPITRWSAHHAIYNPRESKWALHLGRKLNFDTQGSIIEPIEDWSRESGARTYRTMAGWAETPWRITSATMDADQLTVPELNDYLRYNADFPAAHLAPFRTNLHNRWAAPFTCLAVIFLAAPLGIVFSRGAVLASVASSIFIFFGYLFLMFLLLALGKGGHLSPFLAGWLPNIFLFLTGLYFLYLRSTNRELPKLSFRRK